ncbi:hypothetical protein G9A89_013435 [Geosiphon pyriformis]|nr:hypothetical protein G9A89_013435 [Geosiphon pyriformis]
MGEIIATKDTFLTLQTYHLAWYENSNSLTEAESSKTARFWDLIEKVKWPYNSTAVSLIKHRQQQMDGELFIHLLLRYAEIDPSLYPPADQEALQKLADAIYNSSKLDELKSHCLMYYILKDFDLHTYQKFAERYLIPYNWMSLMDGFWFLDQWRFEEAIRFLGEPEVKVDFDIKVVKTLYQHAGPREALIYVDITKPELTSREGVELLMNLLMRCDLIEAFFYMREQPEGGAVPKHVLFQKMLDYCFSEKPITDKLNKMLYFPFNREEESFLENYCTNSEDTICLEFYMMYAVHHHRQVDAIKIYDRLRKEVEGKRAKPFAYLKRSKIIEDLRRNLSPIQKRLLELENKEDDIVEVESSFTISSLQNQDSDGQNDLEPAILINPLNKSPFSSPLSVGPPLSSSQTNDTNSFSPSDTPRSPFFNQKIISPKSPGVPTSSIVPDQTTSTPQMVRRSPLTTSLPNKSPFSTPKPKTTQSTAKSTTKLARRRSPYISERRITRSMTRNPPNKGTID